MRKAKSGLPWFEFMLAVALISAIALGLAERLAYYQALAEQAELDSLLRNVRAGLRFELVRRLALGQSREDLGQLSPLDFLQTPPRGFQGERSGDLATVLRQLRAGQCVVFKPEQALYYRVAHAAWGQDAAPALWVLRLQPSSAESWVVVARYRAW